MHFTDGEGWTPEKNRPKTYGLSEPKGTWLIELAGTLPVLLVLLVFGVGGVTPVLLLQEGNANSSHISLRMLLTPVCKSYINY